VKFFVAAFLFLNWVGFAHGAATINISEVGPNVVMTGSGTIDTTNMFACGSSPFPPGRAVALQGFITVGDPNLTSPIPLCGNNYGTTNPLVFGTSYAQYANTGTGTTPFGFDSGGLFYVPSGYVSGSALAVTSTFQNTDLATLGFTPGTYIYNIDTGSGIQDTITLTISNPVAPPTVTASTANLAINATSLTITGTGFDTTPSNNTVAFNLGAVGTVIAATSTQLTVTLTSPPTSTGNLTAVVTTNGQNSGAAVQVATVVSAPAPSAVPTLSEWAQLLLGLMVMMIIGWHFHRERSY
jgi:IPT/TIG domain